VFSLAHTGQLALLRYFLNGWAVNKRQQYTASRRRRRKPAFGLSLNESINRPLGSSLRMRTPLVYLK